MTFTRLLRPERRDDWNAWYDTVHLPDIVSSGAAWRVTRWELVDPPAVGYTNVNMYEMPGPDLLADLAKPAAFAPKWSAEGRQFADYCILDLQPFRPIGRWARIADPSPEVKGRLAVWSLCSDRARTDEWHAWYDDTHIPNMLEVEGVASATRWERLEPLRYGANHVAFFDLDDDPKAAVERMSQRAAELAAQGQVHPCFCPAQVALVQPVGRWASVGYTAGVER